MTYCEKDAMAESAPFVVMSCHAVCGKKINSLKGAEPSPKISKILRRGLSPLSPPEPPLHNTPAILMESLTGSHFVDVFHLFIAEVT